MILVFVREGGCLNFRGVSPLKGREGPLSEGRKSDVEKRADGSKVGGRRPGSEGGRR